MDKIVELVKTYLYSSKTADNFAKADYSAAACFERDFPPQKVVNPITVPKTFTCTPKEVKVFSPKLETGKVNETVNCQPHGLGWWMFVGSVQVFIANNPCAAGIINIVGAVLVPGLVLGFGDSFYLYFTDPESLVNWSNIQSVVGQDGRVGGISDNIDALVDRGQNGGAPTNPTVPKNNAQENSIAITKDAPLDEKQWFILNMVVVGASVLFCAFILIQFGHTPEDISFMDNVSSIVSSTPPNSPK